MIRLVLLIITLALTTYTWAMPDSMVLERVVPIQARLISADGLGNLYVVRYDNELLRYNENGDSTGFYRGVYHGPIERIDATNPLNILLYYPKLNKVQVLDRMLAPKWELDLAKLGIYNSPAVCMSVDGSIWVYDRFEARLRKINENLQDRVDATDNRALLNVVPVANYLIEQERKVYLCDSSLGVFIFDQFANYVGTVPIQGLSSIALIGNDFLVRKEALYKKYDRRSYLSVPLKLSGDNNNLPLQVVYTSEKIIALYESYMAIYKRPK